MSHDAQKPDSFNVAAGLKVQREQLAIWKARLNPDCYAQLEAFARMKNESLEGGDLAGFTGYDVARGGDLDNFVHNWHPDKTDDATRNDLISLVRTNPAHTPGPWQIGGLDQRIISDTYAKDGENEASARLIAAAPELLEALRDVCEQYDTLLALHPQPPFGWGKITTQPAKELIARIEGKPAQKEGAK